MQKLSVKKFSALGLILLGASVVTAAVLPSKEKDSKNGVLVQSDSEGPANGILSCVEALGGNICTANSQTFTTVGEDENSFNDNDRQTVSNTSLEEQQSVTN